MTPNTIETILDALAGASRAEWEMIRKYIDEYYDAAARRLTLPHEEAENIARKLCNEQGLGSVQIQPATRQTRMF